MFRDAVRAVRAVRYFVTRPVSAPHAVRAVRTVCAVRCFVTPQIEYVHLMTYNDLLLLQVTWRASHVYPANWRSLIPQGTRSDLQLTDKLLTFQLSSGSSIPDAMQCRAMHCDDASRHRSAMQCRMAPHPAV